MNVISVVDDDASVRSGTVDLLNSFGFACEAYASAEKYLGSERIAHTSCLILDVNMPGLNGLEAARHIRSVSPNTQILVLTMHESEVAFQAIVDPYARADFFFSFGEQGVNLEEGYLTFPAIPGGLLVRVGKMRAAFGKAAGRFTARKLQKRLKLQKRRWPNTYVRPSAIICYGVPGRSSGPRRQFRQQARQATFFAALFIPSLSGSAASAATFWASAVSSLPCSAVSQFPIRTPIRRTPFTRRIPAASSGLSRPESAASKATLRTAASRRLMVVDA